MRRTAPEHGSDAGCAFFRGAVRRVIGGWLQDEGFSEVADSDTRVTFRRGGVAISVAYWVEDMPAPSVAVDLGFAGDDGAYRMVGLWRALGDEDPTRLHTQWSFSDEESLIALLCRMVDVLGRRMLDICDSEGTLRDLWVCQTEEAEAEYLMEEHEARLRLARNAFDQGHFGDAIDGFVLAGLDRLSAADRRRVSVARKGLADGHGAPSHKLGSNARRDDLGDAGVITPQPPSP